MWRRNEDPDLSDAIYRESNLVNKTFWGSPTVLLQQINQNGIRLVFDVKHWRGLCSWSYPDMDLDADRRQGFTRRHLSLDSFLRVLKLLYPIKLFQMVARPVSQVLFINQNRFTNWHLLIHKDNNTSSSQPTVYIKGSWITQGNELQQQAFEDDSATYQKLTSWALLAPNQDRNLDMIESCKTGDFECAWDFAKHGLQTGNVQMPTTIPQIQLVHRVCLESHRLQIRQGNHEITDMESVLATPLFELALQKNLVHDFFISRAYLCIRILSSKKTASHCT